MQCVRMRRIRSSTLAVAVQQYVTFGICACRESLNQLHYPHVGLHEYLIHHGYSLYVHSRKFLVQIGESRTDTNMMTSTFYMHFIHVCVYE
jgi:hypothetical protein